MQWPPLANRNLLSVSIVLTQQTFCAIRLAQVPLLIARVVAKYSRSFMRTFNLRTEPCVCSRWCQD